MTSKAVVFVAGLAMMVFAGCGVNDGSGDSDVAFPAAKENPAGLWDAPVKDMAEAKRLCDAAQEGWPDAYAGHDQVTFEIADTGSDLTCVRQR